MRAMLNPAVRRLIRRELRRNMARTVALFFLTFLPVTFAGFIAVVVHTEATESNADHVFGQADAVARTSARDGVHRTEWSGDPKVLTWVERMSRIGALWVQTSDAPLDDPMFQGYGVLTDEWFHATLRGSLPVAPGEAVVSSDLLDAFGLSGAIGETFVWTSGELDVVGVLDVGGESRPGQIVVAPGSMASLVTNARGRPAVEGVGDTSVVSLIDWPGDVPEEFALRDDNSLAMNGERTIIETRADWERWQAANNPAPALMSGLFSVGLSIATGAIAYAAWGSSIRRRLRDVGLLAASGGEPRHVAAVQGGQAFLIATFASVAAIGALMVATSTTPLVTSLTSSDVRWPVSGLVVPVVVAVVVATLAGWWPARFTARMSLAALLSGRRVPRPGVPGSPFVGGLLIVGGLLALGSSVDPMADSSVTRQLLLGGIGLIAISLGVLPILSSIFRRVGSDSIGQSLPVTLRLVLRDASRHAGRSAATVLGIGAVVAAVWAGAVDVEEYRADGPIAMQIFSDDGVETINASTSHVVIADPVVDRRLATTDDVRVRFADNVVATNRLEGWVSESMGPTYVAIDTGDENLPAISQRRMVTTISGVVALEPPSDGVRAPDLDLEVLELTGLDQGARDRLAADDRVESLDFGPAFEQSSGRDPDLVSQLVLLGIGFVVATTVIALVSVMAAGEVRDDLALVALVGVGPRFRSRFLGLQAFVSTSAAVVGGIVVGSMIRLAVGEAMPVPWHVLLGLVALPALLAGGVVMASSLPPGATTPYHLRRTATGSAAG